MEKNIKKERLLKASPPPVETGTCFENQELLATISIEDIKKEGFNLKKFLEEQLNGK